MIEHPRGNIEYDVQGAGTPLVLVPGSCSTGAAWRGVISALPPGYACVTTSLIGYGRSAERRTDGLKGIDVGAETVETVIAQAGGPVHLVGHSFGGLVALAVALRGKSPLLSLTVLEAPALGALLEPSEADHLRAFDELRDSYFAAHAGGDREAIRLMIDFYAGEGTFDAMPPKVRNYACDTAHTNVRDWIDAYAFELPRASMEALDLPVAIGWGGNSHPAIRRANEVLTQRIPGASSSVIPGAAHFMISTHPQDVAGIISRIAPRQT